MQQQYISITNQIK